MAARCCGAAWCFSWSRSPPPDDRARRSQGFALCLAVTVELSRLIHAPWLDDFRLTTAGALLLGRVFSLWNMAAYGCGIAVGAALDWVCNGKTVPHGP
jgi:hypothetical protein